MKIKSIKLTINCKRIDDVDQLAKYLEKATSEHFKTPFKKIQGFNNMQDDFPRFVGDPKLGFNLLLLGNGAIVEFRNVPKNIDDSVILETLSDIGSKVGANIENEIDCPFSFVGLTTQIALNKNDIGEEPLDYMIKKMHGFETKDVIDHLDYHVAYIESPYYINLAVTNVPLLRVNAFDRYSKPTDVINTGSELLVTLDINDKYGFMHDKQYFSQVESIEALIDGFINLYSEKLLPFIKESKTEKFMR